MAIIKSMVTLGTLSSGSRTTVLLCTFKFTFALIRGSKYVIRAIGAHLKTRVLMIIDIYNPTDFGRWHRW